MAEFRGHYGRYGRGSYVPQYPRNEVIPLADFTRGYVSMQGRDLAPRDSTPSSMDIEVTPNNMLRRVPGVAQEEHFGSRSAQQMLLHPDFNYSTELVFVAPPLVGIKREGTTVWRNEGIDGPVAHTVFGNILLLSDGRKVWARKPRDPMLTELEGVPIADSYATFAARAFAFGCYVGGNWEPLAIKWSAANSNHEDWESVGAGHEFLVDDLTTGDRIIKGLPINLDYLVAVLRRSIWMGRRTGQTLRPVDMRPVAAGTGGLTAKTITLSRVGIFILNERGVILFDGTPNVTVVSEAINSDLLPLDLDNIESYSSYYDPVRHQYFLMTTTGTWVYDIDRQRWHRRSLVARGATRFASQSAITSWDQMQGSWDSAVDNWEAYVARESLAADLYFLSGEGTALGREVRSVDSNFSEPLDPYWEFPRPDWNESDRLFTTKHITVKYEGGGRLQLLIPDLHGDFVDGPSYGLVDQGALRAAVVPVGMTGLGPGLKLRLSAGDLRVSRCEIVGLPRGFRVSNSVAYLEEDV